ncbi:MAG: ATP-binding protein [Candidatus Aminicenantes bacterium]|nr:ATP-binding protein [Candidatus Aminicenantes bacterium]
MKRDIDNVLLTWKNDPQRRPLLVRGARQVGKSYSITQFGQKEFTNLTIINFEQRPEFKTCFDTLNPKEIIGTISLLSKNDITPGKTLLFLDEIQECPKAITALRYFYEQMPELHVIAAGSLLEFTLGQENFKMPVGRIQYLYMKPLSFCEFLDAAGEHKARELIENITWENFPNETIMTGDFIRVNSGAVAEQFTAQELLAYQDVYRDASLYYWAREERSSNAEVDYLAPYSGYAFPIEVKAGKTGTLRSMHLFLEKYPAPVGIRVSQQSFSKNPHVISVPFYGITVIPHLLRDYLAKKE